MLVLFSKDTCPMKRHQLSNCFTLFGKSPKPYMIHNYGFGYMQENLFLFSFYADWIKYFKTILQISVFYSERITEFRNAYVPVHPLPNNQMSCSNRHIPVFPSLDQSQNHLHNLLVCDVSLKLDPIPWSVRGATSVSIYKEQKTAFVTNDEKTYTDS